jgi:23S rRNA pseudouridine1911/1915/1917 synthase
MINVAAIVEDDAEGIRLDRYISEHLQTCSRSQIDQRVSKLLVDGRPAKLSLRLKAGQKVSFTENTPPPLELEAEEIPLEILYEDSDVVVVNKARGMVVHPGAGNRSGTFVNALLGHVQGLDDAFEDESDGLRPGIAHRLDKETTGVLIAAKHPDALAWLSEQFKERRTEKTYVAAVRGELPHAHGRIDQPLGRDPRNRKRFAPRSDGKAAVTSYRCLYQGEHHTVVRLHPETGRTHQLRVHMAMLNAPIIGDTLYGRATQSFAGFPLMLHAYRLRIELPGGREPRTFEAPLPPEFSLLGSDRLDLG